VGTIKIRPRDGQGIYYVNSLLRGLGPGEAWPPPRGQGLENLTRFILPHFKKYPLLTQKRADFELFKQIVFMMNNKEHLT
jgi:hypothetical protein